MICGQWKEKVACERRWGTRPESTQTQFSTTEPGKTQRLQADAARQRRHVGDTLKMLSDCKLAHPVRNDTSTMPLHLERLSVCKRTRLASADPLAMPLHQAWFSDCK